MEIKNIVFDFGGVLVDWNPRYFYSNVFENEKEMEFFLKHICNDEWNSQLDKGKSFKAGIEIQVKKHPKYEKYINLYQKGWPSMLKDEIKENSNLIPILKKEYPLYGLTNWSAETFPIALERFQFFKEFKGIIVSGEENMIKPEKEIFELLLNRYNLEAYNSLFIDDNHTNIKVAKEIGFQTIHFSNGINLEEEFKRLNII